MEILPRIDVEKTGKKIEEMRKAAGMTVRDLQTLFGFSSPQAIYKWQKGITLPTVDNLVVLARVFGVRMDDIIMISEI